MMALIANWKLVGGALTAILFGGYIGLLNVQLANERRSVAMLDADLVQAQTDLAIESGKRLTCDARLKNILEREASDALVPDDLTGFDVPDHWLRRLD